MFKLKDRVKRIGEQEVFTVENIHEPDEHVLGLNPAAEFNLARTLLRDWSLRKANLSWRNDHRLGLRVVFSGWSVTSPVAPTIVFRKKLILVGFRPFHACGPQKFYPD